MIHKPNLIAIRQLVAIKNRINKFYSNLKSRVLTFKLFILLFLLPFVGQAQLAALMNADYLVVSKSTNTSSIEMDRGHVIYDMTKSQLNIDSRDLSKKEKINTTSIDIGLTSADQLDLKSFQHFNEVGIYDYILNPSHMDHGMTKLGFTSTFIDKDEDGIFIKWRSNEKYANTISKVLTKIHNNKLDRIEYFDTNDKLLCEVIYEEFGGDDNITPYKIKTRYHFNGVIHDRMIKLSHIKMLEL